MKLSTRLLTGSFILFISMFLSMPAFAEDADADSDESLRGVGRRTRSRIACYYEDARRIWR